MRTPFFDIDFDPLAVDSPETAGAMGQVYSDMGAVPTFTNRLDSQMPNRIYTDMSAPPASNIYKDPMQLADSGQIMSDMQPPSSSEPDDKMMDYMNKKMRFVEILDEEMNKNPQIFGSATFKTPEQELKRKEYSNTAATNFDKFYWDNLKQSQTNAYSQGAVTTQGNAVSFNKASGQWEVAKPDGTKEPWNQETHGKIQNAMSTTAMPDKSFREWDDNAKNNSFKKYLLSGTPYRFSTRDAASTQQYEEEYTKFLDNIGISPEKANVIKNSGKALASSLTQQEKQRGAMGNFVRNVNKQADYAEELFEYLKRTDTRALNIPLRLLRTKFQGSGLEQVYEMYIKEISAEANKLSQGATASIAVLPEGNRQEWEKIHDVNMPIAEQRRVFQGTRDLANNRMASVEEEITNTENKIEQLINKYSTKAPSKESARDISSGIQYLKKSKTDDDTRKRIQELKKQGWSKEEVRQMLNGVEK